MNKARKRILVFGVSDNGYIFDNMRKYWAIHSYEVDFIHRFPLWYLGKFFRYRFMGGRIIHFNFVGGYYSDPHLWLTFIKIALFLFAIFVMKLIGLKLVWTIHNTLPHEEFYPWLTRPVRTLFYRSCHEVIVHGTRQRVYTESLFGPHPRMHIIPLGNVVREKYLKDSLKFPSRQEARVRLQITDQTFLFLSFGRIRPYKRLEFLIEAFSEHTRNFQDSVLYLVGHPVTKKYQQQLLQACRQSPSIRHHFEYVSDEMLSDYLVAADTICITNEMYGMTENMYWGMYYGRPIIGGNNGCIGEIIEEYGLGIVYESGSKQSLTCTLCKMRETSKADYSLMVKRLKAHKDIGCWDEVAKAYIERIYSHYISM